MSYKLSRIRVLVIDDNTPIRMLIRSLLLDLGVGVVDMAAGAEEGWESFIRYKPDIIFVDWHMDSMDGVEFTMRVRRDSDSPNPTIPIIMMTGFTNKERVFLARDAGVTEFLIKPFTVQGLSRHLSHVIENPRQFVVSPNFVGPDRRRRTDAVMAVRKRRRTDKSSGEEETKKTVRKKH